MSRQIRRGRLFRWILMDSNASLETESKEESWVEDDIELIEEDVKKEIMDGVPSIDFSKRVYSLIEKSMARMVVVKLLGRTIGYNTLWNKGQWVIFGHYLTVQPWFPSFTTLQSYPHKVVAWIRVSGLSGTLYKKSILYEIGEMIGTFIKIDLQTDKGSRSQFDKCLQNQNEKAMNEEINGDKQHFYGESNLIVAYHLSTSDNHGNNQVHGNNHDYHLDCFHDPLGLVLE
ncbi:hypothetical protein CXB51_031953 [Gossypium anomalum]|uniref:DUF4283 domain-containing protein n=1 Tax=Gossypium anomalum TaxID=47600 RepID=A0A8J6CM44_9ROSI|nr:hypothetical protein CXB51_031953 [Gossypium anomalum]